MDISKKKRLWADALLIAFFLVLAAALYAVLNFGKASGAGVVVRVDGRETARYSLERDGVYELNGGTNILVIENGEAWLREANCPDKLCVKQGKIRISGQVITCLPNKLTVTVYGTKDGVDAVV